MWCIDIYLTYLWSISTGRFNVLIVININCNKNVMNEDINDDETLLTYDVNDTDWFSSIKVKILSLNKNIRK